MADGGEPESHSILCGRESRYLPITIEPEFRRTFVDCHRGV